MLGKARAAAARKLQGSRGAGDAGDSRPQGGTQDGCRAAARRSMAASTWLCSGCSARNRSDTDVCHLCRAPQGDSLGRGFWEPSAHDHKTMVQAAFDEECAKEFQTMFDDEARKKDAAIRFSCPICFDEDVFDNSIQLDCEHRLCQGCFHSYVEVAILERRVGDGELVCPMIDCDGEITVAQVEGATRGTQLWDRYLESRQELWCPSTLREMRCTCPTPGCISFVVEAGTLEVRCPQCNALFCTRCGQSHKGSTCEQHKRWLEENDDAEKAFLHLAAEQHWQRCPKCNTVTERSHGCNFMTCQSTACRGGTFFCYMCGDELDKSKHFSHFPSGPMVNKCVKVDKTQDPTMQGATLPGFVPGQDIQARVADVVGWVTDALDGVRRP